MPAVKPNGVHPSMIDSDDAQESAAKMLGDGGHEASPVLGFYALSAASAVSIEEDGQLHDMWATLRRLPRRNAA